MVGAVSGWDLTCVMSPQQLRSEGVASVIRTSGDTARTSSGVSRLSMVISYPCPAKASSTASRESLLKLRSRTRTMCSMQCCAPTVQRCPAMSLLQFDAHHNPSSLKCYLHWAAQGLSVLVIACTFAAPYSTPKKAHHHHPNHCHTKLHAKPNGIQ